MGSIFEGIGLGIGILLYLFIGFFVAVLSTSNEEKNPLILLLIFLFWGPFLLLTLAFGILCLPIGLIKDLFKKPDPEEVIIKYDIMNGLIKIPEKDLIELLISKGILSDKEDFSKWKTTWYPSSNKEDLFKLDGLFNKEENKILHIIGVER